MNNKGLGFGKETENALSARKSASQRALREHLQDVKTNYPDIWKLRNEIGEISRDFADKIIASPADAESLEALAKTVLSEKEDELCRLLAENGLPADYLKLKPFCPVCGDTGYVDGEMCSCLKRVLIDKIFSGSGINRAQSFEAFRHDLIPDSKQNRAMERIFAYCLEYAECFPNEEISDIIFMGEPGVGKTYLLNCIGGRVLKKGHSVLKITANRLVSSVMDSIRNDDTERPDFNIPELLIIDDLGTEPMINNVTLETILSVICERQDADKATLIATNKSIEQLSEEYGERIVSRLLSPQRVKAIKITTPSIRVMKI
ncbi:MAG: ATP-binding protein [Clostridiales bacterium]|nr:ATP-binding protein [Clostridiales bacterium]